MMPTDPAAVASRARELADETLFPIAQDVDRGERVPAGNLEALAAAGLFGMAGPTEYGGLDFDRASGWRVAAAIGGACGATGFVWAQHHTVVRVLRGSTNEDGHHLVAEHLGEGDEGGHRAVGRILEVHQHLLGVRPADAAEAGAQHGPVLGQHGRVGHVLQGHRRGGQVVHQAGGAGGDRLGRRLVLAAEHQGSHGACSVVPVSGAMAAIEPARNVSMSSVLKAATALRSGR
jgi:hypothetical protein